MATKFTQYNEVIDYLFSQLPMYQRQGKAAYKADLSNTWKLMDILSHPYKDFKSIHLAGTNGKGSTAHLLSAAFQEAGYKTGLYTSPHLTDFRERVKINGKEIPESFVIEFVNQYKDTFESIGLSFFEWTVGLAFAYFKDEEVDIAIVETGLGGRLDSTNVITPEVSIITNIGLDHTQFLGGTRKLIAAEKAGIIKPHVPVVIGEYDTETAAVFVDTAKKVAAPLHWAKDVQDAPKSSLMGVYQRQNEQTAYAAIQLIEGKGYTVLETLPTAWSKVEDLTGLKGRWQILGKQPLVIADTAHNVEGLTETMRQLQGLGKDQLRIVFGVVNDKSIESIIHLLPKSAKYYLCEAKIPRAMKISDLTMFFEKSNLEYEAIGSVSESYEKALSDSKGNDAVYIGGSTFVVAEIV